MKAVYICVLAAVVWPCYAKLRVHRIYDNPTCNDANGDRLDCGEVPAAVDWKQQALECVCIITKVE